ncbi:MAG TPA: zinc-ribbon domain-containing protein, partial [Vicinamibacteria bacterium]|nr:zinc-ribbon domain-containing protein [Vicinamibacteria bacterium]
MIIVCPSCQSRYKFDESRLGGRPKVKTKCAKCGGTIEIENPLMGAMTLPPGNLSPAASPPAPAEAEA